MKEIDDHFIPISKEAYGLVRSKIKCLDQEKTLLRSDDSTDNQATI